MKTKYCEKEKKKKYSQQAEQLIAGTKGSQADGDLD